MYVCNYFFLNTNFAQLVLTRGGSSTHKKEKVDYNT